MKAKSTKPTLSLQDKLKQMPYGFFPFPQRTGEEWCVYFKFSSHSVPQAIEINLTQQQAESKATAFNLTLVN